MNDRFPSRLAVLTLCLLGLAALASTPADAQGLPNERAPANRGTQAVDPESGTRDSEAPTESDETPRGGMPSGPVEPAAAALRILAAPTK